MGCLEAVGDGAGAVPVDDADAKEGFDQDNNSEADGNNGQADEGCINARAGSLDLTLISTGDEPLDAAPGEVSEGKKASDNEDELNCGSEKFTDAGDGKGGRLIEGERSVCAKWPRTGVNGRGDEN